MSSIEWFFRKPPIKFLEQENARLAAESVDKERTIQRLYTGSLKDMHEMNALTARVAELEAALKPFAEFAPSLRQWRHSAMEFPMQDPWPDHKPVLRRTYPQNLYEDRYVDLYKSQFETAAALLAKGPKADFWPLKVPPDQKPPSIHCGGVRMVPDANGGMRPAFSETDGGDSFLIHRHLPVQRSSNFYQATLADFGGNLENFNSWVKVRDEQIVRLAFEKFGIVAEGSEVLGFVHELLGQGE